MLIGGSELRTGVPHAEGDDSVVTAASIDGSPKVHDLPFSHLGEYDSAFGMNQIVGLVVAFGAGLSALVYAQAPAQVSTRTGTAIVAGRVVDGETGKPVPSAVVTLGEDGQPALRSQNSVLTDATGRFVFSGLGTEEVEFSVSKPGYLPGAFGQKRPSARSRWLDIKDGDRRNDLVISLWRYGTISGRIVDDTGDPFIGVDVRLAQQSFVSGYRHATLGARVVTDDRGMFRFTDLVPGDYIVLVPAIVTSQPAPLSSVIGVNAYAQTMSAIGTAPIMWPDADQNVTSDSHWVVTALAGISSVPPEHSPWLTYPTTFFPSATSPANATAIRVVSGHDQAIGDMLIHVTPTFEVSGTVSGLADSPASMAVHLIPADAADSPLLDVATAITDASGEFNFYGVPAGQYIARVVRTPSPAAGFRFVLGSDGSGPSSVVLGFGDRGGGGGVPSLTADPLLHASVNVAVADRDVRNVALVLRAGAKVSGHLEFDGASPRPTAKEFKNIRVSLEPASGRADPRTVFPAVVADDGTFTSPSTWPGRYLVRLTNAIPGWTFVGATAGGRDVSESPLDLVNDVTDVVITFSDHASKIQGSVQPLDTLTGADAVVLLFPADPDNWKDYGVTSRRLLSMYPLATGTFSFDAPPAGDYLIVAVPDDSADWVDWRDPAVLQRLSAIATRISIRGAAVPTLTLPMKRVPR